MKIPYFNVAFAIMVCWIIINTLKFFSKDEVSYNGKVLDENEKRQYRNKILSIQILIFIVGIISLIFFTD